MADLDHLAPTLRASVEAGIAAMPYLWVESGARSHARQQQLYNDYLAGRGNPANRPGTSNHEYDETSTWPITDAENEATSLAGGCWALAVDFGAPGADFAELHARAAEFGLVFPLSREPWHGQPIQVAESYRVAGAWRRLPQPAPPAPPVDLDPLHANGRLVVPIGDTP